MFAKNKFKVNIFSDNLKFSFSPAFSKSFAEMNARLYLTELKVISSKLTQNTALFYLTCRPYFAVVDKRSVIISKKSRSINYLSGTVIWARVNRNTISSISKCIVNWHYFPFYPLTSRFIS